MLAIRLVSLSALLFLLPPAIIFAADEYNNSRAMAQPFVEMMLYEAAQEAVEDGYAKIIPEPAKDEATAPQNVGKNSPTASQVQLSEPDQKTDRRIVQ